MWGDRDEGKSCKVLEYGVEEGCRDGNLEISGVGVSRFEVFCGMKDEGY